MALLLVATVGALVWRTGLLDSMFKGGQPSAAKEPSGSSAGSTSQATPSTSTTSPSAVPGVFTTPGPINTAFPGLTTFRGNASRSYYGQGPLPTHPKILWRYPTSGGLCGTSTNIDGTRVWCGTGWTGQPNVIVQPSGKIEVRIGAYDGHYHFLNGATGKKYRPDLITGDLAKGSATSDPDGFPLYYAGSRDNFFRIIALDRSKPVVLWKVDANANPNKLWNDDWDGAGLVIGDYLLEGGENSWFYVVRINRHYDESGLVQVNPKVVALIPGYDDELFADLGDKSVSIENSVAYRDGVVYFANSGGLVQGWDISDVLNGGTKYHRVFRFWDGDETDASIVIDEEGYLYAARHVSFNVPTRPKTRDHQIGSLIKLDPRKPNDPVVWDRQIGGFEADGGILGTPAIYDGVVLVTDTAGALVGVDQQTGKQLWRVGLAGPTWGSPVPVDGQVLVGDCNGVLHDFDISNPRKKPKELWTVQLQGCIESTPAVWDGMIYVGSRGGAIYGIGDAT